MAIIDGGFVCDFPQMVKVKQSFNANTVEDIRAKVFFELEKEEIKDRFKPGQRIAITVGSRGVADVDIITKAIADKLKEFGTNPFIIPAMGSHGGATPEGQRGVLASYKVTEETMGVPIVDTMETIQLGTTASGIPVYLSKAAFEADGIVVAARVKAHTNYRGPIESGLVKMMVIGLGKHRGATYVHAQGFARFAELIPDVGREILKKAPITCGLALVENGYHQQMVIEAALPEKIEQTDAELLKVANQAMPRILFDDIDVLIVEQIGKNISGGGMDPNVTGRFTEAFLSKYDIKPRVQKIVVLGLTPETNGNACGIGDADLTTKSVFNQVDLEYTYANVITSTVLKVGAIPMMLDTEEQAIVVALRTCNRIKPHEAKVVRIRNTGELDEIEISEALLPEAQASPNIEVAGTLKPMAFAEDGRLL